MSDTDVTDSDSRIALCGRIQLTFTVSRLVAADCTCCCLSLTDRDGADLFLDGMPERFSRWTRSKYDVRT